ncbi:hypothetical protein GALMADRAFT_235085 [Galerina marginata CBS 339.88]|uniref:Uncharacterized protein n=1 Tax=Galerina marginata (strain CBS 339.88) TaxID=685588 RepID=A0A067TRT2_GALM3|nr:hypothetical protein GALMADRAFT_235085 [Galerina marginata CBS 339.88]
MYRIRLQIARRRRRFVPNPGTNGQFWDRCMFKSPGTNASTTEGMFESPGTGWVLENRK